jgi:small subunit ribosomal protein S6
MRKYELMTIFPVEEELFKAGLDSTKEVLTEFGVEIEKEDPWGERDLAYEVQKRRRGRYVLLLLRANPAKLSEIDRRFKLNANLLRYLFVRLDEKD